MAFLHRLQKNTSFSESEESEEDRILVENYPTIEDVRDEMDIARYYRSLCANTMFGKNLKSKSIQTDHDSSGLPPSWINAGQILVDEMYTGLGNIINNLHQPPSFKPNAGKVPSTIDVQNMKYFKYENGYWRSKLDPKVKFPADSETYRQMQIIYTENFKKELGKLMQVATKLRDLVSHLNEDKRQSIEIAANGNRITLKEDKWQQTEIVNTDAVCNHNHQEIETSENTLISLTDISYESSKIDYASCSEEKATIYVEDSKIADRRQKDNEDSKMNSVQFNTNVGKSYEVVPNIESSQFPGIKILKYKVHPEIRRCVSEDAERLNSVPYENVTGLKRTNGVESKIILEKRKMFAQSKIKDSKHCSKLVNQASQPSTSKFQMTSSENAVSKFDRIDYKFVKPLGEHNISNLERGKCSIMNEFPSKRPKTAISGKECKNFIKQNILASKLPLTRAGSNHVMCEMQNATSEDALPFTHSVAGSGSPQSKRAVLKQTSLKNRNRFFK